MRLKHLPLFDLFNEEALKKYVKKKGGRSGSKKGTGNRSGSKRDKDWKEIQEIINKFGGAKG